MYEKKLRKTKIRLRSIILKRADQKKNIFSNELCQKNHKTRSIRDNIKNKCLRFTTTQHLQDRTELYGRSGQTNKFEAPSN